MHKIQTRDSTTLTHSKADRRTNELDSFVPRDQLKGTPPHAPNLLNKRRCSKLGYCNIEQKLQYLLAQVFTLMQPQHEISFALEGTQICCGKRTVNTQPTYTAYMMSYCP